MISSRSATVKCPYCGTEQRVMIRREEENHPKLVLCDIEDVPGCDRWFAVLILFEPIVADIYTLHSVDD